MLPLSSSLLLGAPLLSAALLCALPAAQAAPPRRPLPPTPPRTLGHLSLGRVDVALRGAAALLTVDLTFTRGSYREGDVGAFAAYGAPGLPAAFEAQLVPVEPGYLLAPLDARGKALESAHAQQAPREASLALGPRAAAGQRFELPSALLREALAPSGLATLRLRSVLGFGAAPGPRRSLLVRATEGGRPLPLGLVRMRAAEGSLASASASLCAPGRSLPLALAGQPARPPLLPPSRLPPGSAGDLCLSAEFP